MGISPPLVPFPGGDWVTLRWVKLCLWTVSWNIIVARERTDKRRVESGRSLGVPMLGLVSGLSSAGLVWFIGSAGIF